MITKEKFLNAEVNQISQVYEGKRDCCRCGCGGEYIATSFMENPRSEVNDKLVEAALNRAKNKVKNRADIIAGSTYFDVCIGKNKTLTFYFNNLKPIQ